MTGIQGSASDFIAKGARRTWRIQKWRVGMGYREVLDNYTNKRRGGASVGCRERPGNNRNDGRDWLTGASERCQEKIEMEG